MRLLVEAAVEETLAYHRAFPEEHWRRIRTNNPLERILREIRRRTRVVGAFPDGQSALSTLAAARLRHICRHRVVDQTLFEYRPAEGPADERSHHRLSQYRAPLSPNKCAKNSGHYRMAHFLAASCPNGSFEHLPSKSGQLFE